MKTSRRGILKSLFLAPFTRFLPTPKPRVVSNIWLGGEYYTTSDGYRKFTVTHCSIESVDKLYIDGKLILPSQYKVIDNNGYYKVNWPVQTRSGFENKLENENAKSS